MLSSMYSGISGLTANTQRMAVIGDNIANVNTMGYKGSILSFESLINPSVGGFTGNEIGSGVMLGDVSYDWNQGTIQRTTNPYDMAIAGSGFFMVKDASGDTFYTRDGEFNFDASGNLTTSSGMVVQGCVYANPPANPPVPVPITIDPTKYQNVTVDSDGVYWAETIATPPVKTALFQAVVCDTTDRSVMAKNSNNLYSKTTPGAMEKIGVPNSNGLGSVDPESIEMSNVDIAKEFVNMITAQRAFSACSKVITTSDEILQELVNMKR
ncbi:MAG: flagellar hook basal-body protein [Deltaproteobacteria bacterium]|nr:flagellar hook basal-body protein [Deltaproteobacteria bacterium]